MFTAMQKAALGMQVQTSRRLEATMQLCVTHAGCSTVTHLGLVSVNDTVLQRLSYSCCRRSGVTSYSKPSLENFASTVCASSNTMIQIRGLTVLRRPISTS